MENFEIKKEEINIEKLKAQLSKIAAEIKQLTELSELSGENIDAELGSDDYKDYGHMAQVRELEIERKNIEEQIQSIEDQSAAQRNLPL